MKKVYTLLILCTVFICSLSLCPVEAFQDDSFNDSQYEQIGSLGLGHLISDGQIDELDFTNGSGDIGFLVALGKSIVTKDPTYILEYGLNWATAKAEEILQSLKNWFSLNFPDLYEFFTGVKTEIKYNPMPLETRRGLTQLLKDRVDCPDPIQPNPDSNYIEYLQLINGNSYNYHFSMTDNWISNYDITTDSFVGSGRMEGLGRNWSYVNTGYFTDLRYFNNSSYWTSYVASMNANKYTMRHVYACEPITLYINSVPDSNNYILTSSLPDAKKNVVYNGTYYYGFLVEYDTSTQKYNFWTGPGSPAGTTTYPNLNPINYTGSLTNCLKVASMNFRNVDIYVNGDLWSVGLFENNDSLIYPIGIPDNFEILSGVQGGYYYPSDSYWNLDGLMQLIKQAITEYGVISISDIEPLIVDINGVQAVRTTNVARTDYDNLISEQYSVYPDSDVLQVPAVVLDNGEVISFIASSSGSDLIPDDIMLVLCGGGILLLIGYLINRMLE